MTDSAERTIVEEVYGTWVGMARNGIKRINRAAGGARVIELWGASHFAFLANKEDGLREMRAFPAGLL